MISFKVRSVEKTNSHVKMLYFETVETFDIPRGQNWVIFGTLGGTMPDVSVPN